MLNLDPGKSNLAPDEIVNGTAWLLDTSLLRLIRWLWSMTIELVYDVNEVDEHEHVNMSGYCIYQGKAHQAKDRKLVEC